MAKQKYLSEAQMAKIKSDVRLKNPQLADDRLERAQWLQVMRKIAEGHKGVCLSQKYVNQVTAIKFRCEEGHEFRSLPVNVINSHWCPKCRYEIRSKNLKKIMIERVKTIVEMNGGQILFEPKDYKGSFKPVKVQCAKGHTWSTRPTVLMRGSWCPICKKETIGAFRRQKGWDKLSDVLKAKKWTLVGPEYVRLKKIYSFRCDKGHTFKLNAYNLVLYPNKQCPKCKKGK